MDLGQRRELNNGFGESLARAFELVVTPGIIGFLGHLLDRRLGTSPLFMLVLAFLAFGYLVWKFWGDYDRRMQVHEERLGIARKGRAVVAESRAASPQQAPYLSGRLASRLGSLGLGGRQADHG